MITIISTSIKFYSILGGIDFDTFPVSTLLESTEIISADGRSTKSIDLPKPVAGHAIGSINDTYSIITGGYNYEELPLDSSWYYNHIAQEFNEGPKLSIARRWHSAGALIDSGTSKKIPVVTGGKIPGLFPYLDSTIFLIDGIWQKGNDLIFSI